MNGSSSRSGTVPGGPAAGGTMMSTLCPQVVAEVWSEPEHQNANAARGGGGIVRSRDAVGFINQM